MRPGSEVAVCEGVQIETQEQEFEELFSSFQTLDRKWKVERFTIAEFDEYVETLEHVSDSQSRAHLSRCLNKPNQVDQHERDCNPHDDLD